jgi:hypothetical protein
MNSDMPPMPPKLNGWGPSLSKSYQWQMIDKKYVKIQSSRNIRIEQENEPNAQGTKWQIISD